MREWSDVYISMRLCPFCLSAEGAFLFPQINNFLVERKTNRDTQRNSNIKLQVLLNDSAIIEVTKNYRNKRGEYDDCIGESIENVSNNEW